MPVSKINKSHVQMSTEPSFMAPQTTARAFFCGRERRDDNRKKGNRRLDGVQDSARQVHASVVCFLGEFASVPDSRRRFGAKFIGRLSIPKSAAGCGQIRAPVLCFYWRSNLRSTSAGPEQAPRERPCDRDTSSVFKPSPLRSSVISPSLSLADGDLVIGVIGQWRGRIRNAIKVKI